MCLSSIDIIAEKPSEKIRWGWKVFIKGPSGLYPSDMYAENPYPTNTWQKAKNVKVKMFQTSYTSGFHIFVRKNDAEKYKNDAEKYKNDAEKYKIGDEVIRRVEYRNARIFGEQSTLYFGSVPTIIADWMRILED